MQWFINMILELVDAEGYLKSAFVDRGNVNVPDWQAGDLTRDSAWHDLDCSPIVPADATGVLLRVAYMSTSITRNLRFRNKGVTGWPNTVECRVVAANVAHHEDKIVAIDENRLAQYFVSHPTVWNYIQITIAGWYF